MQKQHSSKILTTLLTILLMAPIILAAIPIASATTGGAITVRPTKIAAGAIIRVDLSGLTVTGTQFDLYLSKNGYASVVGDLKIATALAKGTAEYYYTTPTTDAYSAPGDYYVKATDDLGATVVVANKYTILEVPPTVTIDPTESTLPKAVKVKGAGFPKDAGTRVYNIYADEPKSINWLSGGTVAIDSEGKFPETSFTIYQAKYGKRAITVYVYDAAGVVPEYGVYTFFTVKPLATVVEASITADATGQTIRVGGRGFSPGKIAANSTTVTVKDIAGTVLKTSATTHAEITVTDIGSFGLVTNITMTIAEKLPMGVCDITVAGFTFADAFVSSKKTVGLFVVKLSKYSANVGDSVTFLGLGFNTTTMDMIKLKFVSALGVTKAEVSFTADSNGAVRTSFAVPHLPRAVYDARVIDTGVAEKSIGTFEIIPKLIVYQTETTLVDKVTGAWKYINIYGTGFPEGYKASKVLIGGVEHSFTETTALPNGDWSSSPGLNVTFSKDVSGGGLAVSVVLTDIPAASVKILPMIPDPNIKEIIGTTWTTTTQANLGDPVKVEGKGFLAAEAVSVKFINATTGKVVATAEITSGGVADSAGKLTVVFKVPTALNPGKTYKVSVAGATASNKYDISLTTYAYGANVKIYLNLQADGSQKVKGYVGDSIVVMGTGTPDSKETVKWAGTAVATDVPVTKGCFTATITVPETEHGKYAVSYDPPSADYKVHANIVLDVSTGYLGNVTTITGKGFKAKDDIKIQWNLIPLKTVTASDKGSFTTTFTVPTSSPGFYRVDAVMTATSDKDGTTIPDTDDVLTASFTVLEAVPVWVAELRKSLADLSKVVDELSKTVKAQAADITALKTALDALKTAVSTLQTDVTATKTVVDALKTALTALQSAVAILQTDVTATKGLAGDAKTAATDAKTSAAAAQSSAAGLTTLVYVAIVLSLIAAIAAIVAVIQLQRKVAG